MSANKNFFVLTQHLEEIVQVLNDKVANTKMNRKDILVWCMFPVKVTGIEHEVFFHEKEDAYVPQGTVDFYGRFDGNDNKIHIEIIFNPKDNEFYWNLPLWGYIRSIYIDTLCHEIVHLHQFEKRFLNGITTTQRNPSKKEFKCIIEDDEAENGLYLIEPDEVEAYAYNFASQLFRRYRDVDVALDALRKQTFNNIEVYDFYSRYIKNNSHIHKRLMKKTTWYLLTKYSEETYENETSSFVTNKNYVENKE